MTIDYKDIQIYFEDVGHGECVLLLHGFLESTIMWQDLLPELSKTNRVITVDLLGHGKTGCLGYIHTMEMMAAAVHRVIEYLKIERAILIGHSMGGYVALAFAELYPNEISGLCLMNSTSLPDNSERQLNRDRAINAVKHNHKTFISMSISNLFAPENRVRLKKSINSVKSEALKTPIQGIVAALEGMKIRKNRHFILSDHAYKKMMIIGRKDPILEYEKVTNQCMNTDVQIVEFSDGHMSYLENKEELTYNLIHFVEK